MFIWLGEEISSKRVIETRGRRQESKKEWKKRSKMTELQYSIVILYPKIMVRG